MGQVKSHPVMRRPTVADLYRAPDGSVRSSAQVKALYEQALKLWAEAIGREQADPIRYGWEPPIWKVCDALLGLPLFDEAFRARIVERFGWSWEEWSEALRLKLFGFSKRLRVLLISGPNRSGKTEYAAKRTNQLMSRFDGEIAWCYAQNNDNSIEIMQPALYRYLPAELKAGGKDIKSKTTYIKYSQHNGFTDNRYVLPNESLVSLRNYSQKEETLEGPALKWVWADELIPPNFQKTLEGRIGDRGGWMVDTFTPIKGWSATVNMFMSASEIVKACDAFLLPLDKDGPDEVRAYGFFTQAERDAAWGDDPRRTLPEDVHCWLEDKRSQPEVPAGRVFERAPRVVKCFSEHRGVVFFQPMDNPFGNPAAVFDIWRSNPVRVIKERLYGWATKTFSGQFPRFNKNVHVIPGSRIPVQGTRYQMIDPTPGGRPFFLIYVKICGETMYVEADWPAEHSPGVPDVPFGKWAEPSGKKDGVNDGEPADGADSIGWGVERYVREFARIEGWDFEEAKACQQAEAALETGPDVEDYMHAHLHKVSILEGRFGGGEVERLPGHDARLKVEERGLDSRAATAPRIERDRSSTLYEMFKDYGLEMCLAPGIDIAERVAMVNTLLDYDENEQGEIVNPPRLYIAAECRNLIFALEYWTGADGLKGATKDPVDCLAYSVGKMMAGEWVDLTEELEGV